MARRTGRERAGPRGEQGRGRIGLGWAGVLGGLVAGVSGKGGESDHGAMCVRLVGMVPPFPLKNGACWRDGAESRPQWVEAEPGGQLEGFAVSQVR